MVVLVDLVRTTPTAPSDLGWWRWAGAMFEGIYAFGAGTLALYVGGGGTATLDTVGGDGEDTLFEGIPEPSTRVRTSPTAAVAVVTRPPADLVDLAVAVAVHGMATGAVALPRTEVATVE